MPTPLAVYTSTLDSPHGPIVLEASETALVAIRLGAKKKTTRSLPPPFLSGFIMDLERYFKGNKVSFHAPLDLGDATPFRQKVWKTCAKIPFGETRTYGQLATRLGNPKASRAVGQALGRNPVPIVVPCHRVLSGGGRMGGFSAGLDWKRFLLDLEGIGDLK